MNRLIKFLNYGLISAISGILNVTSILVTTALCSNYADVILRSYISVSVGVFLSGGLNFSMSRWWLWSDRYQQYNQGISATCLKWTAMYLILMVASPLAFIVMMDNGLIDLTGHYSVLVFQFSSWGVCTIISFLVNEHLIFITPKLKIKHA